MRRTFTVIAVIIDGSALAYPTVYTVLYYLEFGTLIPWLFIFFISMLSTSAHIVAESLRKLEILRFNGAGTSWESRPIKFTLKLSGVLASIIFMYVVSTVAVWKEALRGKNDAIKEQHTKH